MKVSGFTIIRNAIIYDYPIVEAIKSILPICDEFVVALGQSTDDTRSLILSINSPKIKILDTFWDESIRENGNILAVETNKAIAAIAADTDWAFYIQADEVVHERYLDQIYGSMLQFKDVDKVDGLLFNYLHFYATYDYVANSSNWYKNETRIIKTNRSIYSYRDAQGFRKGDNKKLRVKSIEAYIFHYGWVKATKSLQQKNINFNKYWHDDEWIKKFVPIESELFEYGDLDNLSLYTGTHPKVMVDRIARLNWKFKHNSSFTKFTFKEFFKSAMKKYFNIHIGYKNYKLV